jgi:anaerobic selenocysteine-containing dehydrogenase
MSEETMKRGNKNAAGEWDGQASASETGPDSAPETSLVSGPDFDLASDPLSDLASDPVSRRGFMKLMGASMALAGLAGCTKQPDESIYPYVKSPEDLVLGKPMYFATAHPFVTGAVPLLVKSDEFRPIKIDGNPEHPYNLGASDPFTQATLLEFYDPDRSQHVTYRGENREWAEFEQALRQKMAETEARAVRFGHRRNRGGWRAESSV